MDAHEQLQHDHRPAESTVLVAIDAFFDGEVLVRAGRQLAECRGAPWVVVTVDDGQADQAARKRLAHSFDVADGLGAELRTLRGHNVADELLSYAHRQNVRTVVVGHSTRRRWFCRQSLGERLANGEHALEVMLIPVPRKSRKGRFFQKRSEHSKKHYLWAVLSVAPATVVALLLQPILPLGNLSLVFLTGVLGVAAKTGIRPALVTALTSFLTYNFFFTEPRLTFHMVRTDELVTVVFFLLIALIGGELAGRLRQQVQMLRATNDQTEALLKFTKRLAAAQDVPSVFTEAVSVLSSQLGAPVMVLERTRELAPLEISAEAGNSVELSPDMMEAAEWTFNNNQSSGYLTDTLSGLPWRFEAVGEANKPRAVLALYLAEDPANSFLGAMVDAYTHQLSLAVVRTELAVNLSTSKIAEETERLRSALLSSVSHDLRTPLASMIGSASSLRSLHGKLSPGDRDSLLDAILNEGQRLDRYIRNLLDMTKLGHGELKIEGEWIAFTDILASALRRTRALLEHVRIERRISVTLPLLFVQPALIEQALVNVLENAAKFAPADTTVQIEAKQLGDEVHLTISDEGPGIPEPHRPRVFDMFYTGGEGDRGPRGSGLGLAICHGLIHAHGGRVEAQAGPQGRGTLILIILPLQEGPADYQGTA